MTQTFKRVPGQRTTRRLGLVYAYDTLCVDGAGMATVGIEVGYVGKTFQRLSARDDQHRGLAPGPDGTPAKCQPFSDVIVGSVRVVEQGMWTDEELAERETFHIHRLAPRYNDVDNRQNPRRIPIFEARRHRDNRDRAKGVQPQSWAARQVCVQTGKGRPRALSRRTKRRLGWAAAWAAMSFLGWLLLALFPPIHAPWTTWPILSAGVAAEPLVLLYRHRSRRTTRRVRKVLAVGIAVATVILMAVVW